MSHLRQETPVKKVYDFLMKKLITRDGHDFAKITTETGGVGYVSTSIPEEALRGWHAQLKRKLMGLLDSSNEAERAELERLKHGD